MLARDILEWIRNDCVGTPGRWSFFSEPGGARSPHHENVVSLSQGAITLTGQSIPSPATPLLTPGAATQPDDESRRGIPRDERSVERARPELDSPP